MDNSSLTNVDYFYYALYAVAYITSIIAFSMSRIEWLRILIIISSACYAIYYYLFPAEPLWLDVVTEGGFVAVNVVMLFLVTWKSSRINLTENEVHLHDLLFNELPKHEFAKLLNTGSWHIHEPGEILITDGERSDRLYYIYSGETEVTMPDGMHHVRKSGSVLGELGYRLNKPASGTVTVTQRSVCIQWLHHDLHKLTRRSANIKHAIDAMVSEKMAAKLAS